jgi:hypothetical protein
MPVSADQITELKHSYRVLDVPLAASTSSIKRSYRKLIKRWHPDLYPEGTLEYAEATQMTKSINAAYSTIQYAPLRYHVEACPRAYVKGKEGTRPSTTVSPSTGPLPKTDWLEFWIRFVFGSFLGALLSIRMFLVHYDEPNVLLAALGVTLVFGFAAAQSGDNFWHSILRRWWMWW